MGGGAYSITSVLRWSGLYVQKNGFRLKCFEKICVLDKYFYTGI